MQLEIATSITGKSLNTMSKLAFLDESYSFSVTYVHMYM